MRRTSLALPIPHRVPGADFFMSVTVNGKVMDGVEGLTIEKLLKHLDIDLRFTAVSLNGEIVPKQSYVTTLVRENDRVEIVRPVGGG